MFQNAKRGFKAGTECSYHKTANTNVPLAEMEHTLQQM